MVSEEQRRCEAVLDEHREVVGRMVDDHLARGTRGAGRWREVAECLLARNASIYMELATSPTLWRGTVAPMLLRPMIEVNINLKYIAMDPVERAEKFIAYGLSQGKMFSENFAKEEEEGHEGVWEVLFKEATRIWEEFVEEERKLEDVKVKWGDWEGGNTRKRAQEAGMAGVYRHGWNMFSPCIHGTWQFVGRFNGFRTSPGGRLKGRITAGEGEWTPHYLYVGAKYLDASIETFDEAFHISIPRVEVQWMVVNRFRM